MKVTIQISSLLSLKKSFQALNISVLWWWQVRFIFLENLIPHFPIHWVVPVRFYSYTVKSWSKIFGGRACERYNQNFNLATQKEIFDFVDFIFPSPVLFLLNFSFYKLSRGLNNGFCNEQRFYTQQKCWCNNLDEKYKYESHDQNFNFATRE